MASRRTAVHGCVSKRVPYLGHGDPAPQRALHIDAELIEATQRGENAEVQDASGPMIETWVAPRRSPGPLRDDPLERHHEVVGFGEACVDVLRAKHFAAHLEALLEQLALGHSSAPLTIAATRGCHQPARGRLSRVTRLAAPDCPIWSGFSIFG